MEFFSSIGSFVSSVGSSIGRAASSVWNSAKEMGSRALNWMAEKAENFVGNIKDVWNNVKPFLTHIQVAVRAAATATATTWPWLSGALLVLDKGIEYLKTIDSSPIMQKINKAIEWAIHAAKTYKNHKEANAASEYTDEELKEAQKHQETLQFAERETPNQETQNAIAFASLINDYRISSTLVSKTINDNNVSDFTHYLRLRATQKLLVLSEKRFSEAKTIDDLSADDIFIVRIASDLIKSDPKLSSEAAQRLDRLLAARYKTKLAPFIFEEMIASWNKQADTAQQNWKNNSTELSALKTQKKRLQISERIQEGGLDPAEQEQLIDLNKRIPEIEDRLQTAETEQRDLDTYVGAAEGFLQLLEKDPDQLEKEGRIYLLEKGTKVGEILISCAQNKTSFESLNDNEKILLTDYSNIFKEEAATRMQRIMEVTA